MSDSVGVRELRQNISAVLRRVEAGERLIVTDRNRPVAELVPLSGMGPGLRRLVAEGKVLAPSQPLDFTPVPLGGQRNPASAALEYTRGDRL